MLDKLWDDVVARPQPERGLEKLRRKRPSTPKEKFESEIKESVGDISNEEDVNVQASGSITIEKEASLWNKVVGGPRKGRIYGFGEGSIISGQIPQSISSQGSSYVPNNNEDSFEQMEVMHEEAEKAAQDKREKEEMQRKIQNLETIVQQLLAKNGMSTSSNDPPTSGSNIPE